MRPILLLTIAATTILAGCVTPPGDEPVETASAPGAAANGTVAAGAAATTVTAANGTVIGVATPFTFDGKVPAFAEACAFVVVVGRCVDAPPTADWMAMRHEIEPAGTPTAVTVVATWTASAPTNEEMTLFAYSYDENTWQTHGWAYGASGVTFELEHLEDFVEGGTLVVGLAPPSTGTGAAGGGAWGSANAVEQPFHLEGVVVEPGPAA